MTPDSRLGGRAPVLLAALAALLVAAAAAPGVLAAVPVLGYRVVNVYPHDPRAFTQGLLYHDGRLYESTGGHGESTVRVVDLASGAVLASRSLEPRHFGEGLALVGDRLVQLTWLSRTGFVWDLATLEPAAVFHYPTQGWGLAFDGRRLVLSDGSAVLWFLDPETYGFVGRVTVRADGVPVARLNELELVRGRILANVWETDRIARIDPASGRVEAWIDLSGLLDDASRVGADVLNGIAWDADGGRLFVTGKRWPKLFEIEILE